MEFKHLPVMLNECLDGLNIKPNGIYVDGTLGGAGHSSEILKRIPKGKLIAIDKDGNEHKFHSLNEASRFTKPFSHNSVKSCASAIKKSIINNEPYAGFTWKILDNF